ncbi:MAG: thymidine phosphorylase [Candidatus Eisenbacteria bacterium]|uniref:Thymidine phosphorylase n=1 Tax=Eiseniibacteriota bacterium TaxID=2212470 RepID=A0A7Y2E9S1_UNCEI|nr:thymidine phosphorylase [Candidatus Eisenbacteria bacterium]
MNVREVIAKKRDRGEHSEAELQFLVEGYVRGDVADYQMSAWLMAVFLHGMSAAETATLTRLMVESGDVLAFPELPGKKVDKHSTGGVGDLVSLPLAPLVAAAGVFVPMISGRGLGHTGGTLDKLESIKGLRTGLEPDEFRSVLTEVGFAMGGQTAQLAPADKKMYALRDVTGTVESIPLIVSSILSKKVAEGIDGLVLDVKCGRGAFMKNEEDALALAQELTRVGNLMGKNVRAFITNMDTPLGNAIGNALEVEVAIACLKGNGPTDTMELVSTLGQAMICLADKAATWEESEALFQKALQSGEGWNAFVSMVKLQGGDVSMVENPNTLPGAPVHKDVLAANAGFVTDIDPFGVGEAVVALGGGRQKAEDSIHPGVGVRLHRKVGESCEAGESLATVLAKDEETAKQASARVEGAIKTGSEAPPEEKLVRYLVTADGYEPWLGAKTWDSQST